MKSIVKNFELQIDEKSNGFVIRLNDEGKCILRICQIPKEVIKDDQCLDIIYKKENIK